MTTTKTTGPERLANFSDELKAALNAAKAEDKTYYEPDAIFRIRHLADIITTAQEAILFIGNRIRPDDLEGLRGLIESGESFESLLSIGYSAREILKGALNYVGEQDGLDIDGLIQEAAAANLPRRSAHPVAKAA